MDPFHFPVISTTAAGGTTSTLFATPDALVKMTEVRERERERERESLSVCDENTCLKKKQQVMKC